MGKKLIKVTIERENLQQKWGFSLQGGQEVTLTMKVSSVKVKQYFRHKGMSMSILLQNFTPASIAGLEKMDYVYTVNGKEVHFSKAF